MYIIDYHKEIPVRDKYDVFVAGGGSAGIAAAVTASRQGVRVFLAEAHSCFGGMATAGLVPVFMQFGDGVNFLAGGFGQEIYDKMLAGGNAEYGKYVSINSEKLKTIYDKIAVDCGLDFSFHTTLLDVVKEGDRIRYAICSGKSEIFAIEADYFIDTTGDGDLAVRAKAEFEKGDADGNMMPGTLCSLWAGIDWQRAGNIGNRDHKQMLEQAFREKIFTVEDTHHSGIARTGNALGTGNIGHTFGVDGTDERSLTKALITGRNYLKEYCCYYRKFFEGFENMELATSGSLLGIRETRRICCNYKLTIDDFVRRSIFEDRIGCYCYEVDIHPATSDQRDMEKFLKETAEYRYDPGEHYTIPYRSLCVKGVSNLLTAGRCLCADRYMQSSIRTIPGCYITGQAAGVAVGVAAKTNILDISQVSIEGIQNCLRDIGGYI